MADKEVRVKIIADTSDIKKELSNLEKSLKDLAKVLDNMDNNNLDKTVKSVKELGDAVEKTTDSTKELDDSLDKIDDGNLDEATESAKKLADVLKDTSDKASKGAKEISDSFDKTNKTIKDFGDNVSKIDNEGFDKLAKDVKELDDNFDKTNKSAKEFKDTIEKVDSEGLDRLNKDVEEIREDIKLTTDDMKEFNRQLEKTQDTGKENTTIFDRLKTLLGSLSGEATTFGDKMSSSFEKSKANIFEMISAFADMKTANNTNIQRMNELTNSIDEGKRRLEGLARQYENVTSSIEDMYEELSKIEKLQSQDRQEKELKELAEQYDDVNLKIEKAEKRQSQLANQMNSTSSKIEKQTKELEELGGKTEETVKGFEKLEKGLKDTLEGIDTGDFSGALDGLKDAFSGLFQMIPTEGKVAIAVITALGVALKECAEQGVNQLQRGFDTLGNVFSKISSVAKSFGQEIKNAFENITGMEVDLSSMIETVVDFEDIMVRAGAICGATGEDYEKLEGLARKLGATTRYSASEVAQAMAEMGQQGYSLEEIMTSVDSVLALATVGNLDLARSSEIVTNTLNAFGMESTEASRVADILAQASVKSGTSVEQLGQALENCASTSGALGIEIEDVATAVGLMGDKFIKSGKAGTSLNTFLANMSAPTKNMVKCLEEYNLEGARQKILNGDLIEGYKEFAEKMANLTTEQKTQIATTLAGKEGMAGFLSIVNNGVEGIEELEKAIENSNDVAKHMAETFDNTLKGALLSLSSAIQERLLQVMDKIKPMVKGVIDVLTEFFNIWNGMSENVLGGGFAKAIEWLEKQSREWGKAIEKGLQNIIKSIDDFANSKAFDNLLQVGTNIINGICNGISKAKENGTLDSAINGIITKVVDWVGDNLDTIIQAGMDIVDGIVKGIEQNGDSISKIIKEVLEMQTDIDSSINYAKWKVIGENIGTFIAEGIKSIIKPFFAGVEGFGDGFFGGSGNKQEEIGENFNQNNDLVQGALEDWGLSSKWSERIANVLFPPKETVEQKGKETGQAFADGTSLGVESKKEDLGNKVDQNFKDTKPKTDATANEIGQGVADGIGARLEELDAGELKILQDELKILQEVTSTVAQGIAQSFTDIRNSARTEITGMTNIFRNQFTSMTNIVRNQMVNVANIVKNQATNMTNNFRTSFTNMANIVRNQMTNVSNIVRNQMTNCSNIVRNQAVNMSNIFRNQFVNMANIVRNQMTNVSNIIRNQMVNCANIVRNQATNMSNIFRNQFVNMANIVRNQFTNVTNIIRNQMVNCANIVRNQATNMSNIFRNQFVNMSNIARNQMVNVSNIIRNQATSWSNIIRNQVTNARNSLTQQMISMASVTRTQMVNITNIIRNQATSWSNIIRNQAQNSRNALTSSFMSMHSVVRNQMANCLSTVRSYMSQIASATSRTMTMNFKVNKTVTTTNVTKNVTKGLDPISTMDSMNTNIRSINPSTMASGLIGGDINFNLNGGASGNLALEIPLYIDGREIARATATYSQEELKKLTKRSDRRRGE